MALQNSRKAQPKRNRQKQGASPRLIERVHVERTTKGPIPSPDILQQYENILPGAAERIIHMAELQADHRMSLEKTVVTGDTKRADKGLFCGLTVALAVLFIGGFLIYMGHDWAGGVLVSLDIASLAGIFVYGTISRRSERNQKAIIMKSDQDNIS